jgi:tryptophan synthase beta chain
MEIASKRPPEQKIVVCLSGRGDKDASEIARLKGQSFG